MLDEHTLTFALAILAAASLLLYFLINRGHARYYFETAFDRGIPFTPIFIVPYIAFIPFVVFAILATFTTPIAVPFYLALILGGLATSFTRYFVHCGIRQPRIRRADVYDRLIHWVYRHDDRAHTFPSAHVFTSVIVSYFLALAFPPYLFPIWAFGILIVLSTMFVKQHYLVDVVGGIVYATAAIYLAQILTVYTLY